MEKQFTAEQALAFGNLIGHAGEQTGRWPKSRKHALMEAIEVGALSIDEAAERYALSSAELEEWRRGVMTRRDVQPDRVR